MRMLLLACAGGAVGSGARYLVYLAMGRWLGAGFPWATLTVNVVGSFLMGMIVEVIMLKAQGSPELRTFLATGVLGGFTTFSAFSLDVAALYERGAADVAILYVVASVLLSILALVMGLAVIRTAFA